MYEQLYFPVHRPYRVRPVYKQVVLDGPCTAHWDRNYKDSKRPTLRLLCARGVRISNHPPPTSLVSHIGPFAPPAPGCNMEHTHTLGIADMAEVAVEELQVASERVDSPPRAVGGGSRRRRQEAGGQATVERDAAMALHRTAFNSKLEMWMSSGRHNITLFTEEAWRTAKRDVLTWDSLLPVERVSSAV